MNAPKVSVLMPIYNTKESHLREAIESILNQSYKDFEFLILNDSPDNLDLDAIVSSYKDNRIKYIKNEKNLGITPSRNKLIDISKGEYLAIFDHDDVSLPTRIERQVEFLDTHLDYGVVGTKVKVLDNSRIFRNPLDDENIKIALVHDCAVIHPSAMLRKTVLLDNNIKYEEEYSPAEDYALWAKLIPYTKFFNIAELLLLYRMHKTNASKTQSFKMQLHGQAVRNYIKDNYSDLYELFLTKARRKKIIRLFGLIPFLSIISYGNKTKIKLFDVITILSIKSSIRVLK